MSTRGDGFDADETIADVEARVQTRYPDADPDMVHDEVAEAVETYADAPVKDFVDIIAERRARTAVEQSLTTDD